MMATRSKQVKSSYNLTFDEASEILKHCGNCVKLNPNNLTCFARKVFYFKKGLEHCKAMELNVHSWENELREMIRYSLSNIGLVIDGDVYKELNRVRKRSELTLDQEVRKIYYEEVHRKDRKFGSGEKNEKAYSTKAKLRDNRLVIGWDERRKDEAKMLRLSTKAKRKTITR